MSKLAAIYRNNDLKFRDTFEPGIRVVHVKSQRTGLTGVGRSPNVRGRLIEGTLAAVEDLESKGYPVHGE